MLIFTVIILVITMIIIAMIMKMLMKKMMIMMFGKAYIEGSRPEWCISSMTYSGDTPFWLETLDMTCISF